MLAMMTISHTVPIWSAAETAALGVEIDQLWPILLDKARNPVNYVVSITEAEVVEEACDGFIRETIFRHTRRVRERFRLFPMRRIEAEQLDDPYLSLITNELGYDADSGITFTFTATLSPNGVDLASREPGLLLWLDTGFFDSARGSANTIRLISRADTSPVHVAESR
jgi:hypothetical protein